MPGMVQPMKRVPRRRSREDLPPSATSSRRRRLSQPSLPSEAPSDKQPEGLAAFPSSPFPQGSAAYQPQAAHRLSAAGQAPHASIAHAQQRHHEQNTAAFLMADRAAHETPRRPLQTGQQHQQQQMMPPAWEGVQVGPSSHRTIYGHRPPAGPSSQTAYHPQLPAIADDLPSPDALDVSLRMPMDVYDAAFQDPGASRYAPTHGPGHSLQHVQGQRPHSQHMRMEHRPGSRCSTGLDYASYGPQDPLEYCLHTGQSIMANQASVMPEQDVPQGTFRSAHDQSGPFSPGRGFTGSYTHQYQSALAAGQQPGYVQQDPSLSQAEQLNAGMQFSHRMLHDQQEAAGMPYIAGIDPPTPMSGPFSRAGSRDTGILGNVIREAQESSYKQSPVFRPEELRAPILQVLTYTCCACLFQGSH